MVACCGLGTCVFQIREALFKCGCFCNNLVDSGINYVNFRKKKKRIKSTEGCLLVFFGVRRGRLCGDVLLNIEVPCGTGLKYTCGQKSDVCLFLFAAAQG